MRRGSLPVFKLIFDANGHNLGINLFETALSADFLTLFDSFKDTAQRIRCRCIRRTNHSRIKCFPLSIPVHGPDGPATVVAGTWAAINNAALGVAQTMEAAGWRQTMPRKTPGTTKKSDWGQTACRQVWVNNKSFLTRLPPSMVTSAASMYRLSAAPAFAIAYSLSIMLYSRRSILCSGGSFCFRQIKYRAFVRNERQISVYSYYTRVKVDVCPTQAARFRFRRAPVN